MAEDSDLERTESASPRRLEEARLKGNIPRSRELGTFAVLMIGGLSILNLGEQLSQGLLAMMRQLLTFDRAIITEPALLFPRLMHAVFDSLVLFAPLLLALLIAALSGGLVVGGWLFSTDAISPDFNRSNPLTGLARILSVNSLAELGKAMAKSIVIGGIGYLVISHYQAEMVAMASLPLQSGIAYLGSIAIYAFIYITAGMIIIVGIDVPFQLWEYYRKLKMTKEEVRQEMKESEGDPQLKGRIRSMQREMARKRMMSEVPKADVIVTNPTHYAVAIRYDETTMRTPRVVAKGTYLLATRIQEIASEHRIPILRTPPLARALYKYAELEAEIPVALFTAVAEVLAYVYQLRSFHTQGGTMPVLPEELSVPEGMDIIGEVE